MSHITLLNREEVQRVKNEIHKIFRELIQSSDLLKSQVSSEELLLTIVSELVLDDWKDLGLGTVKKDSNEVYFKVLEWQSANEFRQKLGLQPKDFHITVGFSINDIHNVSKDKSTLIK